MTASVHDLYQSVTTKIVEALEAGTVPWICPWARSAGDMRPANVTTGRPYRGINVLLLNLRASASGFDHNRWLTFQQARAAGGHVRAGEQGTPIVFFKMHEVSKTDAANDGGETERRVVPLLRAFTVFNVAQADGLPPDLAPAAPRPEAWDPIEAAERLLDQTSAVVRHGGSRAFYAPDPDVIQLPARGAFSSAEDYYATALHELTHWTAHASRCARPLGGRFGLDAYAFEELIAEMGAAFLTSYCGLTGRLQHASYIASWLKALRDEKRLIFTAAALAQRAADFVLAFEPGQPNAAAEATTHA